MIEYTVETLNTEQQLVTEYDTETGNLVYTVIDTPIWQE